MKNFLLALALLCLPITAYAALIDQNGQPVTDLAMLAKGRLLLATFGYTQCGDICPMQLMTMQEALAKLPVATRAKIQPVFITVDPARDTPAALKDYLASAPGFSGLTGDTPTLDALAKANGIFHEKVEVPGKPTTIDHTQAILLLDAQGTLVEPYTDADADSLAADLKKRL